MSTLMDDEIKRWTARRKSAMVLEIIQGRRGWPKPAGATIFRLRRSKNGLRMASEAWRERASCEPAGSAGAYE
jgi:hypothetical protein